MKTNHTTVMILKDRPDKWNSKNRLTETDPCIRTPGGKLMINKLICILRDHGEKVSISNSLVLELLKAHRSLSREVRRLKEENMRLRNELKTRE